MGFSDIIGHCKEIEMLKRSIESNLLAHAYLFTGPDGVGKKKVALNFAKVLNCESGRSDPCDSCSSCKRISHGTYVDVQIFAPKGLSRQLKVEQIEQFISQANLKAFEGRKKVFIILDADRANVSFQNKILKILEEPPDDTIIILITSNSNSLLPTIRSRCRILNFSALSIADVEKILLQSKVEKQKATTAALLSEGQVAKAFQYLDPDKMKHRKTLCSIILSDKRVPVEMAISTANEIENYLKNKRDAEIDSELKRAKSDPAWASMDQSGHDQVEEDIKADAEGRFRQNAFEILNILELFYRDMLILKETRREDLILNRDFKNDLIKSAESVAYEDIISKLKIIESTRESIDRNIKVGNCLEILFLRLTETSSIMEVL